mgnify:CR=1 FL=1
MKFLIVKWKGSRKEDNYSPSNNVWSLPAAISITLSVLISAVCCIDDVASPPAAEADC